MTGSSSDSAADEVACDAAVFVDAASHGGSATGASAGRAGEITVNGTGVALGGEAVAANDAPHHLLPEVTIKSTLSCPAHFRLEFRNARTHMAFEDSNLIALNNEGY